MKRWSLTAICLVALLAMVPFVQAEAAQEEIPLQYPQRFASAQAQTASAERLEDYVDLDEFRVYLVQQLAACPETVDISAFRIPDTEALVNEVIEFVWYRTPEAFHVYGVGAYNVGASNYLTTIYLSYKSGLDTAQAYESCYADLVEAADYLLEGVENNPGLTDEEKALLLHDRLAIWTEYNYTDYIDNALTDDDFTAYGVLAKQKGVCQGYTMAYMYLLNRVGVPNDYVDSWELNHAWNIVYIGGEPYHVDVTWDDPVWDRTGYVSHYNFLRSTQGLVSTGHNASDYNTAPTDTKYDSYYWHNSNTAFQIVGENVYYIDNTTDTIERVDDSGSATICSVDDRWYISESSYWSDLSCLGSAGNMLLYSQAKAIYAVDPEAGRSVVVFEPDLSAGAYLSIYAFKYEKGYLICDIASDYVDDAHSKDDQVRQYYVPDTATYTVVFKNDDGTILSSAVYRWGDAVTVPANPTKAADDVYTYTFLGWDKTVVPCNGDAVYTATYLAVKIEEEAPEAGKNGWVEENDKWYFYEDGVPVTNAWRKDSIGWVWLTEDGSMATNQWVRDSIGWCYVGADGYCWTDCWAKDSIGWIWLDSQGSMTKSAWIQNGGKWYWLDKNGYMVSNAWMKDSTGWVWLGADGAMVTNAWVRDSVGWCYVGADGYAVTNCWKKDSVGWCYLNSEGSMTKNAWVNDGGKWYYCDGNGYMLSSTSRNIGGKTYYFNASGVCTNP